MDRFLNSPITEPIYPSEETLTDGRQKGTKVISVFFAGVRFLYANVCFVNLLAHILP